MGVVLGSMSILACGDDANPAVGGSGSSESGSTSGVDPTTTSVTTPSTTDGGTGTGSSGGSESSSTAVADDTGTSSGTSEGSESGSESSTGGVCEGGCPVDQHCESGECVWDEGATIWTETFDTMIPAGFDAANAVAIDSQDEIVVVGNLATADDMGALIPNVYDVMVRKYDVDGGLLWSQTRPLGLGVDVAMTAADEPLVAIGAFGPGAESAALYDAAGGSQWALTGTGAIADGIEVAADGTYFVMGWVPGDTPWAARYAPMGGPLWQVNSVGVTGRYRRATLSDDGLSLGFVGSNADPGSGIIREWLQLWDVAPGTGNPSPPPVVDQPTLSSMEIASAYANGIAYMGNGDVVVVGNELTPLESWNITLTRYAPDGSTVWRESYNSPGNAGDGGFGVAVDSAQNIIIVGGVERIDLAQGPNVWVNKYDPNGVSIWSREHDEAMLGDTANGVAVDSEDNVVVVGFIDPGDGNGTHAWVRKYAP